MRKNEGRERPYKGPPLGPGLRQSCNCAIHSRGTAILSPGFPMEQVLNPWGKAADPVPLRHRRHLLQLQADIRK